MKSKARLSVLEHTAAAWNLGSCEAPFNIQELILPVPTMANLIISYFLIG